MRQKFTSRRIMWFYRLYRYPSPMSSQLMYGVGQINAVIRETSPQVTACMVFQAIETGAALPALENTPAIREALLNFRTEDLEYYEDSLGRGSTEGETDNLGQDQVRESGISRDHTFRSPRFVPEAASSTRPSVLMLEAFFRRRYDAIVQMHRVCPELLSSIPVFDAPSKHQNQSLVTQTGVSQHPDFWALLNIYSSDTGASYMQKTSMLLDAAAENTTLLVFVLQNHPDIDKAKNLNPKENSGTPFVKLKSESQSCSGGSRTSAIKSGHDNPTDANMPSTSTTADHTFQTRESTKSSDMNLLPDSQDDIPACSNQYQNETHSQMDTQPQRGRPEAKRKGLQNKRQKKNLEGESSKLKRIKNGSSRNEKSKEIETDDLFSIVAKSLEPTNPIMICIRKKNIEVLQYLLFKQVWQHFMLDDMFQLSQSLSNSELNISSPYSPQDQEWFLHCAALLGCHSILDWILSGKFQEDARLESKLIRGVPDSRKYVRSSDEPLSNGADQNSVQEGVTELDGGLSKDKVDQASTQHASALLSLGSDFECHYSGERDDALSQSIPSSSQKTLSSSESVLRTVCTDNDDEGGKSTNSIADLRTSPDPNLMLPVSIPVMDRWVSRCIHVRCSPLHLACWRCDAQSIRVLLEYGADVNAIAEELEETLDWAGDQNYGTDSQTSSSSASAVSNPSISEHSVNLISENLVTQDHARSGSEYCVNDAPIGRKSNQRGITPLAFLALGVRSPPDFSLSIGRVLGLVLPTLREGMYRQIDMSSIYSRACVMEALKLLLDAGADVNGKSMLFNKSFRPLELFLLPSIDLYYAPLMPRGGRDSTVLRCLDLERAGEIVLSVCWELSRCGATLGSRLCSRLQWNLNSMDWMFLQDANLLKRFMHLAIFLNLFPPCVPLHYCTCFLAEEFTAQENFYPENTPGAQTEMVDAAGSVSSIVDNLPLVRNGPQSRERNAQATGQTQVTGSTPQHHEVTTSLVLESGGEFQAGLEIQPENDIHVQTRVPDTGPTYTSSSVETASASQPSIHGVPARTSQQASTSYGVFQAHRADCPIRKSKQQISDYATYLLAWEIKDRQQRTMEKFFSECLRLNIPEQVLHMLLRFMRPSDLCALEDVMKRMTHDWNTDSAYEMQYREAVEKAHFRSLRHAAKIIILSAAQWQYSAVQKLPIPDSLKRYLCDSEC